tara:strand:- start:4 stop:786 length:783 start_codon:yes stop_codon:yes gene_type:complete
MWERGNNTFSVEKSTKERSTDRSTDRSSNNRTERPTDRSSNGYNNDRSTDRSTKEKSTERPTDRSSNNRTDRPTNRYNNRPSNDRYRALRRKEPVKKEFVNPLYIPIDVEQSCEENQQVSYLEHCKIEQEKETETEKKKNLLIRGWVSYKYIGAKTQCSRNGIDYYDTIDDNSAEEVKVENEEREAMELSIRFYNMVNELDEKYERESYEHYEMYGELDLYAKAIIQREQYEEYEKQFMIVDEDDSRSSDEEYDLDNVDA